MRDAYEIVSAPELARLTDGFLGIGAFLDGKDCLRSDETPPAWCLEARGVATGWMAEWLRRVPEELWKSLLRKTPHTGGDRLRLIGFWVYGLTHGWKTDFRGLERLLPGEKKTLIDAARAVIPEKNIVLLPSGERGFA